MADFKTVGESSSFNDPLLRKQRKDIANMRSALLTSDIDPKYATAALKNVTVLHVYHQMSRIIRYTELCDKLEEKLYDSVNRLIDRSDPDSIMTMNMLLNVQERMQKLLIESNKILSPFLDMTQYIESIDSSVIDEDPERVVKLDASKRENLRNAANKVLLELNAV